MRNDYEIVIGLEIHVELKTESKIFCSCSTEFGAAPNTLCCPVCMGLPGALPTLNEKAAEYAVKAGLALNCDISERSAFDRKNYFYPDLPKAYQITQFFEPICRGGYVEIDTDNEKKRIGITEIHLEEDAGKLCHSEKGTAIDFNRCGVPLIEIVTEPHMRSADEAKAFLQKLRLLLLYTGISDCKMNEGSLRCDVNLSVRRHGQTEYGTRTEMKNINSFAFVKKAIEYEAQRQIDALERGERIVQETRRFDSQSGKTYSMRSKEDSCDYRYFPEPDLPALIVTKGKIEKLRRELPRLPDTRKADYKKYYSLGEYESDVLTSGIALADYFEECAKETEHRRTLANLILGELLSLQTSEDFKCNIAPKNLAKLSDLLGSARINSSTAKRLLREMYASDFDPEEAVIERSLLQINDKETLTKLVRQAIKENPKAAEDYRRGKLSAAKTIVGRVIKQTEGRANPTLTNEITEMELRSKL